MNQISFSDKKKLCLLVIVLSFILFLLLFYRCGGGGDSSTISSGTGNSAILMWDAPTTNADGTPLTDLAGYKIHYGRSSGNYTEVIDVGNVTNYKVEDLQPGTYYFTVTAYDTSGNESVYSNEMSKTIK